MTYPRQGSTETDATTYVLKDAGEAVQLGILGFLIVLMTAYLFWVLAGKADGGVDADR